MCFHVEMHIPIHILGDKAMYDEVLSGYQPGQMVER
jgi:hypothetical protein